MCSTSDTSTNNIKNEIDLNENKVLTFKDWKTLKDNRHRSNTESNHNRNDNKTKHKSFKNNYCPKHVIRQPVAPTIQVGQSSFVRNDDLLVITPGSNLSTPKNKCRSDVRRDIYGKISRRFYNVNFVNSFNSSYFGINSGINYPSRSTNFNESNNCSRSNYIIEPNNILSSLSNVRHRLKAFNSDNYIVPESFFASDGIYHQNDLMQKPLIGSPFRNERKNIQLIREFNISCYTKGDKMKKSSKKSTDSKIFSSTKDKRAISGAAENLSNNQPEIYIPNPKAMIDGKSYIPKPKIPEQNFEITKEEKKQQWKDYREAMKPFKNREFYNAKRVVQRLGKKTPSELGEKELIRLSNAREIMAAHKARLSAKYANYIKTEKSPIKFGELYVLKKATLSDSVLSKSVTQQLQNYGNFGET